MFHRHNGHDLAKKARIVFTDSRDLVTDSRDLFRTGADDASTFIHAKPLIATLIGAGAGVLLGFLFGGRPAPAVEEEEVAKPRRSRTPAKPRRAARR